MKNIYKRTIFLLAIITLCFTLSAASSQKIYPLNSPIYRYISHLYLLQGKALPSTTAPYSHDELTGMFARIDQGLFTSEIERELSRQIATLLDEKPKQVASFGYNIGLDISLQAYAHTNLNDFTTERDWSYGFNERKPFLNAVFETWPTKNFYSYFEFSVMNNFGFAPGSTHSANDTPNYSYGLSALTTNIPMVPPNAVYNLDLNFPYRAFVSAGGDHWNVQVGRDKLSWGAGKSGNISISNNMPYQQIGRFTTYFDSFKYTLLSSFFTHPQILDPAFIASNAGANNQDLLADGIKMFLAHRVEFRFLKDTVGLAITESMMYQSSTGSLDLRFLNPVGVYHNQYIRGNSNSMLVFEGDYTPFRGWNIYGQLGIDEIAIGEPVPPEEYAKPSAFAYLLGVQKRVPLRKGIVSLSLEGVYTDPFFYLREQYNTTSDQFGVGFDGIIRVLAKTMENLRYVQGYPYGGDAVVANFVADYEQPGRWSTSLQTLFMAHGVLSFSSAWDLYDGTGQPVPTTPSTENPFDSAESGPVAYSLLIQLSGQYNINSELSLMAHLALPLVWNKGNVAKPLTHDIQLSVGLHYTL